MYRILRIAIFPFLNPSGAIAIVDIVKLIFWGFIIFSILLEFVSPSHWHLGFRNRKLLTFVSLLILIWTSIDNYHLHLESVEQLRFLGYSLLIWTTLILFMILRVYFADYQIFIFIVIATLVFPLILLPFNSILIIHIVVFAVLASYSLIISRKPLKRFVNQYVIRRNYQQIIKLNSWVNDRRNDLRELDNLLLLVRVLTIIITATIMIVNSQARYSAVSMLVLFIAAINPIIFLSRRQAQLRFVFQKLRRDRFYALASPVFQPTHWLNFFLYQWIPRYFTLNNSRLLLFLIIIFGGVIIPVAAASLEKVSEIRVFGISFIVIDSLNFLELMVLGVVSIGVLSSLYFAFWLLNNRNQYIVTHFEISNANDQKDIEVQAIATLSTHLLVEELQKISSLLKHRQVENVNFSGEEDNAFIVTSGTDQEFINQIQQIVNIDNLSTSVGARNINNFVVLINRLLAQIRIEGKVQRRETGSVEIWVELNYRNSQSAAVDMVILPDSSIRDIDEVFIRPITRELALKLLIELGQVEHLGSSWESLGYYVKGLQASAHRDWLQAIYNYRRAINVEETLRGSYGIGHFHLGASLVFKGDWQQGLEHLFIAESDGPPLAETQYMIALVLLYMYWGNLHDNEPIFEQIRTRCKQAFTLRRKFSEAYHLLGIAYYRYAKLKDRSSSKIYGEKQSRQNYSEDYQRAVHYLHRAINSYGSMQRRIDRSPNYYNEVQQDEDQILRHKLTASHQLGDALRCLERYSEADTYYFDVLAIYPRNLRNLADTAKIYCLAENWQRAEEYLWRVAFSRDLAYWDVDCAFHMAWAILGGVSQNRARSLKSGKDRESLLIQGLHFLDHIIYQRPRYISAWRQTNWYQIIQDLDVSLPLNSDMIIKAMNEEIDPTNDNEMQFKIWLILRIYSYISPSFKIGLRDEFEIINKSIRLDLKVHKYIYIRLRQIKIDVAKNIRDTHEISIARNLRIRYDKLKHANDLQRLYNHIKNLLNNQREKHATRPNLIDRWLIDVFAETSLLRLKMLAEGDAFFETLKIAHESIGFLEDWVGFWSNHYQKNVFKGSDYYKFSPLVFRYQLSSLYAWRAYASYKTAYHPAKELPQSAIFDAIESDIEKSRQYVNYHPLALYAEAMVSQGRGLYSKAIELLQLLLDVIAPYDPKKHIGVDVKGTPPPEPTSDLQRTDLYYIEKVSGRQQFSVLINHATVHIEIAKIFFQIGDAELSVHHLTEAVRQSSYNDLDIDILLRLSNQLNSMERYDEALAVINGAQETTRYLTSLDLSESKRRALNVMECIISTRSNEFDTSAVLSEQALSQLKHVNPSIVDEYRTTVMNAHQDYMPDNTRKAFELILDGIEELILESTQGQDFYTGILRKVGLCKLTENNIVPLIDSIETNGLTSLYEVIRIVLKELDYPNLEEFNLEGQITNIEILLEPALSSPEVTMKSIDDAKLDHSLSTHLEQVMAKHIYLFLSKQAENRLSQMAELFNISAYNFAEMGIRISTAYSYAIIALIIMHYLVDRSKTHKTKSLRYRKKLAQLSDTYGWLLYRDALQPQPESVLPNKQKLKIAEQFLKDGVKFDPERGIIHYHLARVYLLRVEMYWMESPTEISRYLNTDQASSIALLISQSFRSWREANRQDKYNRLHEKLSWLYNQISAYKRVWEARRRVAFIGTENTLQDVKVSANSMQIMSDFDRE